MFMTAVCAVYLIKLRWAENGKFKQILQIREI